MLLKLKINWRKQINMEKQFIDLDFLTADQLINMTEEELKELEQQRKLNIQKGFR